MLSERKKFITPAEQGRISSELTALTREEAADEQELVAPRKERIVRIEAPPDPEGSFEAPRKTMDTMLKRLQAGTDETLAREAIEDAADSKAKVFRIDLDALREQSTPQGKRLFDSLASGPNGSKTSLKNRFFTGVGAMVVQVAERLKGAFGEKKSSVPVEAPGQAFGQALVEADRQRARRVVRIEAPLEPASEREKRTISTRVPQEAGPKTPQQYAERQTKTRSDKELQAELKELYPERNFRLGAAEQRKNGFQAKTVSLEHAISIQIGSTKKGSQEEPGTESGDELPRIRQTERRTNTLDLGRAFEQESDRRNQDAAFWDGETGLMGVADGAGGHAAGELASAFVAEHIADIYKEVRVPSMISPEALTQFAEEQVTVAEYGTTSADHEKKVAQMANELAAMPIKIQQELLRFKELYARLHEKAREAARVDAVAQGIDPEEYQRLTTVAMGKKLSIGGQDYIVALNVGDSRIKKIRTDGTAVDIIREHSLIEAMRIRGINITPELIARHRNKIIAGLGREKKDTPFITVRRLAPGEKVAFMTDGISDIDALNDNFVDALNTTRRGANAAFSIAAAIKFERDWKQGERAKIKNDDATLLVMENQPSAIDGMRKTAADNLAFLDEINAKKKKLKKQLNTPPNEAA